MTTVLLAEDDPAISEPLARALQREGYAVLVRSDGTSALSEAMSGDVALVVLDLGLPDMDGLDVCRALRGWSTAPVIVLSARPGEEDKAALFEAGADDYVTKPFSTVELRARVSAQLRRARMTPLPGEDAPLTIEHLVIDTARRRLTRDGDEVHLTPTEWGLLRALLAHADRPATHRALYQAVWGNASGDAQQYLRVYVGHLRRKLEIDPVHPQLIITEPGVGYRLVLERNGSPVDD
jgi:two-component system KDP operon response regulator KdpE